jgi:hypothetical protein
MLFIIKEFIYNQQSNQQPVSPPDHISNAIELYVYGHRKHKNPDTPIIPGAMSAFVPLVFMVIVFKNYI